MSTQTAPSDSPLTPEQGLGLAILSIPLWAFTYYAVQAALASDAFMFGVWCALALIPPALTARGVAVYRSN